MAISDRDAYIITRVLEYFAFLALGIFFGWFFTRRRYVREVYRLEFRNYVLIPLPLPMPRPHATSAGLAGQQTGITEAPGPEGQVMGPQASARHATRYCKEVLR